MEVISVSTEALETVEVSSSKTLEPLESVTTKISTPMGTEFAESLEATCLQEEIRSGVDAIEMAGSADIADQRCGLGRVTHPKPGEQNSKGNDA